MTSPERRPFQNVYSAAIYAAYLRQGCDTTGISTFLSAMYADKMLDAVAVTQLEALNRASCLRNGRAYCSS
jgi:hypothetical protein